MAVVLLIAANAFFVGIEFALVTVNRGRVAQRVRDGSRSARVVESLLGRLSHQLSGAQLGITVSSLALGFVAEPAIASVLDPVFGSFLSETASRAVSIALALGIATVAQMLLGELIPKGYAIARPLGTALVLGPAMRVYNLVFGPVISFLNGAANWTVRRFGIEPREELFSVRSLPELELLFQASAEEGTLDRKADGLLRRSIRFGEKTAAAALVPRTDVVALSGTERAGALVQLARESGHSRFPVYGLDLDDIEGVVHVKSVLGVPVEQRTTTLVTELMKPVPAVPETKPLEDVLVDIQSTRNHLVVVVDEYGGTAGILTLEDIVEEIVGDISDEYDRVESDLTVREDLGEWMLSGSLHPDEVLDACGFEVPDGEYETLAGFALARLGCIPDEPGSGFEFDGWVFEVSELDGLRVAAVRVRAPHATGGTP